MTAFLTGFWNSIVDTVVGGTTYTIDFFKQIGLSVAGAVGYVFASILKFFFDIGLTLVYIVKQLFNVVGLLFKPLIFIFNVIINAFPSSTNLSTATTTVPTIASSTTSFFSSMFPSSFSLTAFWGVIYALFMVALLFGAVKMFKKV